MGWGTRVHRPTASGIYGGKTARYRPRVVISSHEVTITSPMTEAFIFLPMSGKDLNYATDLYQRIYCVAETKAQIRRTVMLNGALHSASPSGSNPPDENATWSEITASLLGEATANTTRHVQQIPTWFTGHTHVDLWTWIYQPAGSWDGEFTVVHELWGNFFRWNRITNPAIGPIKPIGTAPDIKDTEIKILTRDRG
jgi:hypothetical protein